MTINEYQKLAMTTLNPALSETEVLLNGVMGIYAQVPAPALDDLLQKEFSDGNSKALSTFLFSMVNSYRLQLIHAHQRISQLENEIKSLKAAKK